MSQSSDRRGEKKRGRGGGGGTATLTDTQKPREKMTGLIL